MNLVIRSALFYVWYIPSGVLTVLFILIVGPFLPLVWRLGVVGFWQSSVNGWLRYSCGVRFSIEGTDSIPPPPYVVISNHQGEWEAFCFQSLFHPLTMVVKRELLNIPLFGWALALLRPVAIRRENPRQAARKILADGTDRLGRGISVLLFPEGTRMAAGVLGRYKRSSLALASQNGVPVVPVVHNSGDCWPARRFIKYPGMIRVVVGEPFVGGSHTAEKMNEITRWAEVTLKKIREMNT